MDNKLNLTVVCGGQSTEHEISILSTNNILAALDKNKYHITLIYITQEGRWYLIDNIEQFLINDPQHLITNGIAREVAITMGEKQRQWIELDDVERKHQVDCVFPVLHGPLGEDGTIQGLFEMMNAPYVGANVLSSAICMDKTIAKALLKNAGLPTADWITLYKNQQSKIDYQHVAEKLSDVVFVKPANSGSSVGVSKAKNQQEFDKAVELAFLFDDCILVEAYIEGREIECSVLGNDHPVASLPGEIISNHEFYSYEAKYLDENGAVTQTPADLSEKMIEKIQTLAVQAFQTLRCRGMARVDFFIQDDQVYINELNTIPGFTNISMYPKNWMSSGLSYSRLLDDLIQLAIHQYHQDRSFSKKRAAFTHQSYESNQRA